MQIRVTQTDIKNGVENDLCNCPIALAVKRATGLSVVRICCSWIKYKGNHHDTPDAAIKFIEAFDVGKPVEPFTFTLGASK